MGCPDAWWLRLQGKVRYGSGNLDSLTSGEKDPRKRQARHMADLTSRSQSRGQIAVEQTDSLLEQAVAAFGIAQLRQETRQLGAGFRAVVET